jgi:D-lactate dehydrogenase (cytochrome)
MIIKKDPDILKSYLEDSSNLKGGYAESVAVPESVEELSAFLREASAKKLPVTVSGGGTSTTGSRIPFGGAVLSLERLNRIIRVSESSMSAVVESGVFVDDLKKACDRAGLFYTCHPTEGGANVGGTIATNASGARSFRYGPTRKYVKRLKVVLPTGEIMDMKRGGRMISRGDSRISPPGGRVIEVPIPTYKMPDVKNAAGYFAKDGMDLIDLFIGQEGTLAVIAEAEIGLVKKPEKIFSAFAFFGSEEDSWRFSAQARERSRLRSGTKSAIDAMSIEYFDVNALALLRTKNPNVPPGARSAIFFEQESQAGGEDAIVGEWMDLISAHNGLPEDTWVAMTEKDGARFNEFRYAIPEAVNEIVRRNGFRKLSADIAVPAGKFFEMMNFYSASLKGSGLGHVLFGHMGECHVHANILPRSEAENARAGDMIMNFVRKGVSLGGTVSAEHGIGKIKHKYLEAMYGRQGILEMARIKKAFDPECVLGTGNVFSRDMLGEV